MRAENHTNRFLVYVGLLRALFFVSIALFGVSCRPRHTPRGPSQLEQKWEAARALERQGQPEEASRAYGLMCEADPPHVRSCFDKAALLLRSAPLEQGRAAALSTIEKFPDAAGVPSLARQLARSYEGSEPLERGAAAYEKLAEATLGTEACDSVLWELSLLRQRQGRIDAEKAALEKLVALHGRWTSQLWDDAVWRLAELAREEGEVEAQTRWLKTLLAARRKSWFIGSYASAYDDEALLTLATVYWERGEPAKAFRTVRSLRKNKSSRLRDDAAVLEATWRHERGELERACEAVISVVEDMPSANKSRLARQLAEQWNCYPLVP